MVQRTTGAILTMGTHAQTCAGLKRLNALTFISNAIDITPEEVYRAVDKELKTNKATKGVAQLNHGWYNITFASENDCDVKASKGLMISGMLIQCELANVFNSVVV